MDYGIKSTHDALKNKLIDYIIAQYFGENKLLQKASENTITKEKVLYQEPYIEANPAYEVRENGIQNSTEIPNEIKEILVKMMENNLGVFKNPFFHQIKALESFFKNKDLVVATGTGSGKTECFMWPMISSLVSEASHSQKTWQQKGVRTLMLYPMNALVSDQISRLRRMIGDAEGKFREVFYENTKNNDLRIPKFGMYTGRTPFPGENKLKRNKAVASTLEKDLLNKNPEIIEKLKKIGKFPSKENLERFIRDLKAGKHRTDDYDAEMITRQEMQQLCPDILITNYSMLEYMLNRPYEKSIWEETKRWLNLSDDNKLLLVIDEAHMYKGASGGEVALLIRRLLNKLGISRDKVRLILTTASVNEDNEEEIREFACNLTAQEISDDNFEIILGKQEKLNLDIGYDFDFNKLLDFDINRFYQEESIKLIALKEFFQLFENLKINKISNYEEAQHILYDILKNLKPMKKLMQHCRGNATSFDKLKVMIFENDSNATEKLEFLLAIAPLAKNKESQVLFPARLHMMFRGLKGVYACSNPHCSEKNQDENISIGKIYFDNKFEKCQCGGKIYELVNDRRCGALFFKGFMYQGSKYPNFIWNKLGEEYDDSLKEVHLYIIPKNIKFYKPKDVKIGWLNSITGKFFENDNYKNNDDFIQVMFPTKEHKGKPNILSFNKCPKCEKSHLNVSDFTTKGNESFYNLVSEQLHIQPPTIFEKEKLEKFPNAGRKVLLFSDSRQRAAVLAKDLTRAADNDAVRKVLLLAIKKLEEWANEKDREPSMDLLYIPFLEIVHDHHLQLFYGTDKMEFNEHVKKVGENIERQKNSRRRKSRSVDYYSINRDINNIPGLYYEQLLKLICSSYHSLSDVGLSWIEPSSEDKLDFIYEELESKKININIDEFIDVFSVWANFVVKDSYALGDRISDEIRENIKFGNYGRFGIENNKSLRPKFLEKILKDEKKLSDDEIKVLHKLLLEFTGKPSGKENLYLNLNLIKLVYNKNQNWYICEKCSGVFSKKLFGKCSHCGHNKVEVMNEKNMKKFEFWRKPVLEILDENSKETIGSINTEEHTAQLSHKDQQDSTWSTTEDYEMRFQDVQINDKFDSNKNMPVDILSCTTTMEVGIDIGSLTAVGLRNVPPRRENYQQRAGRAGRRSSSISTILTFTDNGPHDNFYFLHPEKIISGKVSRLWIDIENLKLINRHINMVIISEFLQKINRGIDDIAFMDFYNEYFIGFSNFLNQYKLTEKKTLTLIPKSQNIDLNKIKENLLSEIKAIRKNPLNDVEGEKRKGITLLDSLYERSVLPTYSFPKNIVGFYVEDSLGEKIVQKPDRALELAINEYSPGKIVVIDKKTYKSGGIYNYHSKFVKNYYEKPAKKYFENEEFFKILHMCRNKSCGWFGLELPENNRCPFCDSTDIGTENLLKPWGFSPINGESIPESEAENEATCVEEPYYSATPQKDDLKETNFENLLVAKRSDQQLIILNKGIKSTGFDVCKICGAAVPAGKDIKKINRPFKHPFNKSLRKCYHNEVENVYLGHNFNTDMVVFELKLDKTQINCDRNKNGRMILKNAAVTLTEALILTAGRLLDVEFSEIKGGTRIRNSDNFIYIDIFLFDSLSSGAGYSSQLTNRTQELLKETKEMLSDCECDSSCHECLNHFWNQKVQNRLNRNLALDLLNWLENSSLPSLIELEKQVTLFEPLKVLLELDGYKVNLNRKGILVSNNKGISKNVIIYPVLLNKNLLKKSESIILLSNELVKNALPEAFHILEKEFK